MIDQAQQPFICLRDVPGAVRRMTGVRQNPNIQTVRRWTTKGVKGTKLETIDLGGRIATTETMLRTFFDSINRARSGDRPRTPDDRLCNR